MGQERAPQQTPALTTATLQWHELFASPAQITLAHVVFSFSIAMKRWGGCLVFLECGCVLEPLAFLAPGSPSIQGLFQPVLSVIERLPSGVATK